MRRFCGAFTALLRRFYGTFPTGETSLTDVFQRVDMISSGFDIFDDGVAHDVAYVWVYHDPQELQSRLQNRIGGLVPRPWFASGDCPQAVVCFGGLSPGPRCGVRDTYAWVRQNRACGVNGGKLRICAEKHCLWRIACRKSVAKVSQKCRISVTFPSPLGGGWKVTLL